MSRTRRIDTRTLILLGVAAVLIAAYWAVVVLSQEYYVVQAPPGSTFSSEDEGARVLINYLEELGIESNTLQQFDELPDPDATIVVMAGRPFEKEPTGPEIRRVRAWIESGGRLVMIGPYASELPQGRLGGPLGNGGEEATLEPLLPSIYVQGVESIRVDQSRMLVEDPVWVSHFKDIEGQVLISRVFGEGEVVWLASLYPASNAGIGEADNARLATLLAGSRGPVYFDEYHHGFVTGSSVWDRLGGNGRAAVLMAVAALVIAIVASARRVAPAIAQPQARLVRTGAYISSLADLYRKAGARSEALGTLEEGLRLAVVRRYGSVEAAAVRGSAASELLDRSRELRESGRLTEESFTVMARELARARQEVEGRHG